MIVALVSLLAVVLLGCNEKPDDELAKVSISIGAKFNKVNTDFLKNIRMKNHLHYSNKPLQQQSKTRVLSIWLRQNMMYK